MANPFVYQNVFGGSNIYPSDISYSAITLTQAVALSWPLESASGNYTYATKIIDVTASSAGGLPIFLPDARGAGVGETILFNNLGTSEQSFIVQNATGTGQIASIAPGFSIQVYLADNSTQAGVWRAIPYGVSTSVAQSSALAGLGLTPDGARLNTAIDVFSLDQDYTLTFLNRAQLINWVAGVAGVITLPDVATITKNWYCLIRNTGNGISQGQLTIDAPGNVMIDNALTKTLLLSDSAYFIFDGANFFTVGFGQNAVFAFDYVDVPLPITSGTFTLAGNYLNRIAYGFTGALTGDVTIVLPLSFQQYWIYNGTTGNFNFFVKAGDQSQPPVQIVQGQRSIVYCNGMFAVKANDNNLVTPVSLVQGGTGSTTAAGALVNLGGSTIGTAVFTAPTQASAQAALGIVDQTTLTVALVLALGG